MKDIEYIPIEEKSLNDKLVNLYASKIPGLYSAVKPLFDDPEAIKPALPLLIELNDDGSYENADLRVMVFGRETNNWNDKYNRSKYPFGSYNFNLRNSDDIVTEIMGRHIDGEEEYYGLGDIYHGYCYEESGIRKSIFTRRQDQLIQQLAYRLVNYNIGVVWNNISKISRGGKDFGQCCGKPTPEIREIECRYFNVVREEEKILKPDIIIFLTGFYADNDIKEKFGLSDDSFHQIREGLFLDRINIPGVKYAARTIHPSTRGQRSEYFKTHFEALVDDIIKSLT